MLIGLSGKKRAGKDTIAARLVQRHGFQRVAFADPLRDAAMSMDPLILTGSEVGLAPQRLTQVVDILGWERAKDIPEVRRTLQRLGVAIREIDQDFWVRAAARTIESARAGDRPVVVTDVRFPNEARFIQREGGLLVRVERPGLAQTEDTHESETALDRWQVGALITNCGSLDELRGHADDLPRRGAGVAALGRRVSRLDLSGACQIR